MTIPSAVITRQRPTRPAPAFGVVALESVVSRLEVAEQRLREAQAAQVVLFAEALDQAAPDLYTTVRDGQVVPDRARAEIAYRTIRAELACALHLSEQTVERRMQHAFQLVSSYPETMRALEDGMISVAHTDSLWV